jgi:hypothetical protein
MSTVGISILQTAMKKQESTAKPQMFMKITNFLPKTLASSLYGPVKRKAANFVTNLPFIQAICQLLTW